MCGLVLWFGALLVCLWYGSCLVDGQLTIGEALGAVCYGVW